VEPVDRFLRGCAFEARRPPGEAPVPYPRADPGPLGERLPRDTWAAACIPVGVRLEGVGDVSVFELEYETRCDDLGYRGDGAGRSFALFRDGERVAELPARLGRARVRFELPAGGAPRDADAHFTLYLPEGMKPELHALEVIEGSLRPAPRRPRWLCYGDSIAEGWSASGPAWCWPAIAARELALDLVNLGYAGAARGEIASAESIAELEARVISVTHGTNCWTRTPHSIARFRAGLEDFLEIVRAGHPDTPIVAASPIVRPDAEKTANRLGATLEDLRRAFEEVVRRRIAAGDGALFLVEGLPLVAPEQMPDGIHPDDAGHAALARALGAALSRALHQTGAPT